MHLPFYKRVIIHCLFVRKRNTVGTILLYSWPSRFASCAFAKNHKRPKTFRLPRDVFNSPSPLSRVVEPRAHPTQSSADRLVPASGSQLFLKCRLRFGADRLPFSRSWPAAATRNRRIPPRRGRAVPLTDR